jgi:hypothetical protein
MEKSGELTLVFRAAVVGAIGEHPIDIKQGHTAVPGSHDMTPGVEDRRPARQIPAEGAAVAVIHAKIPTGCCIPLKERPTRTIHPRRREAVADRRVIIVRRRGPRPEFNGERAGRHRIQGELERNDGSFASGVADCGEAACNNGTLDAQDNPGSIGPVPRRAQAPTVDGSGLSESCRNWERDAANEKKCRDSKWCDH